MRLERREVDSSRPNGGVDHDVLERPAREQREAAARCPCLTVIGVDRRVGAQSAKGHPVSVEERLERGGVELQCRRPFGHGVVRRDGQRARDVTELQVQVDDHDSAPLALRQPDGRFVDTVVLPAPPFGDSTLVTWRETLVSSSRSALGGADGDHRPRGPGRAQCGGRLRGRGAMRSRAPACNARGAAGATGRRRSRPRCRAGQCRLRGPVRWRFRREPRARSRSHRASRVMSSLDDPIRVVVEHPSRQ